MLRVAVLVDNTLQYDRRALLQLETLSQLPIELTVYCNVQDGKPKDDRLIGVRLKRVFTDDCWQYKNQKKLESFAETISGAGYDVVHCHDHFMLHIGVAVKRLKPSTVLVYESRELFFSYPINYSDMSQLNAIKSRVVRRLFVSRERRNIVKADHVIAVNESIALLLQKQFNLKQKPVVIRNAGPLRIAAKNNLLRDELKIDPSRKIAVYLGGNVYPKVLLLEKLMDQIGRTKDYALVVVSNANVRRRWFERYVQQHKIANVFFRDVVPVDQIELYLAGCDVGVLTAWNKKDLSYWHALDNKVFSYIMAGIPVLATAQPEYEKIVSQHDVGVCVNPDYDDAFLTGLKQIAAREKALIDNAHKARLVLNWENEKSSLLELYERIGVRA